MTAPRCITAGTTYLITRRCISRRFLLTPTPEVKKAFLYCLAVAAKRYNIHVHVLCIMSNHYHLEATDIDGRMPEFLQYFHRLVALSLQKMHGWSDVVWEPSVKTSLVELLTEDAFIDKALYTICNPIKAGICKDASNWPGTFYDSAHTLERPAFFAAKHLPDNAELRFTKPPTFSEEHWQQTLADQLPEQSLDAQAKAKDLAKEMGRKHLFRGVKHALGIKPTSRPQTKAKKHQLSPRFAARCQKTLSNAITQYKAFCLAYREALDALRSSVKSSAFPEGTWYMARALGQRKHLPSA